MIWKKDAPLRADMVSNPVLSSAFYAGPLRSEPTDAELATVFPGAAHSLKTWGRTPGVLVEDAHWIGVRKATPMHTDPRYPRFTHHLIIKASPGAALRGLDGVETKVERGSYLVVDTHSPHQLLQNEKGLWYVGVSVDSHQPLPQELMLLTLVSYAARARFLP